MAVATVISVSKLLKTKSIDELRTQIRSSKIGHIDWKDVLNEPLYGRICNTLPGEDSTPSMLSKRGTAFVFGPETVCNDMLTEPAYQLLLKLGYSPQYINLKVSKQKRIFWVLLFRVLAAMAERNPIVPATWSGLVDLVGLCYPSALDAVETHLAEMKSKSCEDFEKAAGFKFMDALQNTSGPLFMGYKKFIALDRPQAAWQTRLFLYCELRVNELFTGDGHTLLEDGSTGFKEYMCQNMKIEQLGKDNYVILPLDQIKVPTSGPVQQLSK